MNKIDGYGAYQGFYENPVQAKRSADGAAAGAKNGLPGWDSDPVKVERGRQPQGKNQPELSEAAQKLLEELKEKYSNMDFVIANYSSDEEAQQLLSRGTKEYSVLIDPETLEKMAADEGTKAKYLDIIDQSTSKLDDMKESLKESGQDVKRIGFSVDSNGQVSYFAELEKSSKAMNERLEASRDKKRAEKKEEEKKAAKQEEKERLEQSVEARRKERADGAYTNAQDGVKRTVVTAGTVEELLEKIQNVNWDEVPGADARYQRPAFDFSV